MYLNFKWVYFDLIILYLGINFKEKIEDVYKDVFSRMFFEVFLIKMKF